MGMTRDDRLRAGGVAGFVGEESWWRSGGSCALVKRLIVGMTALERVSLFGDEEVRQLVEQAMDEERAKWARMDAEVVPRLLEAKGKSVRKKTLKPYWMHTVERLVSGETGMRQLEGDWVMEPESQCDAGELVVVGLRYPEKVYALCVVDKASHASLFGEVRPDVQIVGLKLLGEYKSFRELRGACEAALAGRDHGR